MVRLYPAEPTVTAGETLRLHVASDAGPFRLRLERWGDGSRTIATRGPFRGEPAPCGHAGEPWDWPAVDITVPADAPGGAYVARAVAASAGHAERAPHSPDARAGTALFVVRRRAPVPLLVNLPLFTYHAYNVAAVDGTLGRGEGACLYSGFRSVTLHRPGGGTGGHPWDEVNADAYDRSSPRQTFAHWDRPGLAWLERSGFVADVCTDLDLHLGRVPLERYAVLCSFGHDEYWTREKRARVERFVDGGGTYAIFGGNTCWFRVRYDAAARAIIRDGRWCDDEPENALTGLSYARGGGKWIGERPPTGYRLNDGEVIGADARLVGYECDGYDPALAPAGTEVLGCAPLAEWTVADGSGEVAAGGAAAMVTFRRGAGRVFNAGTVDWARVLAAGDPAVEAITRSVLDTAYRRTSAGTNRSSGAAPAR